jgi:phage shock protein A
MKYRNNQSPVSFFSFQDIILSIVGIMILVTLLLVLKLVTQMSLAESTPPPAVSIKELEKLVETLKLSLQEIQDDIAELYKKQQNSQDITPTQDQIDALQSTIERLKTEIAEIATSIENATQKADNLKNNPSMKLVEEKIKHIEQLKKTLEQLAEQNKKFDQQQNQLKAQESKLQTQNDKLNETLNVSQLLISAAKSTDKKPFIVIYGQSGIEVLSTDGSIRNKFTISSFYSWVDSRDKQTEYFVLFVRPSKFNAYNKILDTLKLKGFDIGLQVVGENTVFSINN